jgi:hypothetical protein
MPTKSKSSMKAMKAKLAALDKEYAKNQKRISDLQRLQTPGLSKLSNVASQHNELPLLPGQHSVIGASGAMTSCKAALPIAGSCFVNAEEKGWTKPKA